MASADEQIVKELAKQARELRRRVIEMLGEAGSGHPGGSLSAADIITVLYWHEMNIDPARPDWPDRDRFVLSKGHAAPILYAALAEKGYFPVEDLKTLRKLGSHLQGHPDSNKTPGVEVPTGSLGQGLSIANGMALAAKMDGRDYRVYALLGDGEIEEGMVWEAAMTAVHYKLDNLVAIVDNNNLQIDGDVREVMGVRHIAERFRSFGWYALDIDGHDINRIIAALRLARGTKGKPTVIVAHTVKGKGVSFMENEVGWHGTAPSKEQTEAALAELAAGEE
ncbi:MAG: transketolase [Firmicutes bacterium]|nr:transketolase [Bacillota bacterium]